MSYDGHVLIATEYDMAERERNALSVEQFKDDERWLAERRKAAKALRGKARLLADQLLGEARGVTGGMMVAMLTGLRTDTTELADLSDRDVTALVRAIFPTLEREVLGALALCDRLPYQAGWMRQPFRAPGRADISADRRNMLYAQLNFLLRGYDQPITWLAAWAPHITTFGSEDSAGLLLAAAIDAGGETGDEVFQILIDSANGEHEIGRMGRHVVRALLTCSRPEGWSYIEKLLLAAQRQEGLRQTILETVDEAHPEAFRRMLRLILDQNLLRFSAAVRAADTWFGFGYDSLTAGAVQQAIETVLACFEDESARQAMLAGDDAEQVYLALWSHAFLDAPAAIPEAAALLRHPTAEHRFAAAHLLGSLGLREVDAVMVDALADEDLRVAARALQHCAQRTSHNLRMEGYRRDDKLDNRMFEAAHALAPRLPVKTTTLEPILWPWMELPAERELAVRVMRENLGERSPTVLAPYLDELDADGRWQVVVSLHDGPITPDIRKLLIRLLSDKSSQIRSFVLQRLEDVVVTPDEARELEPLLSRKAGDLRRAVLDMLGRQPDEAAAASVDRLLSDKDKLCRLAGLELARELVAGGRAERPVRARVQAWREDAGEPTAEERTHLDVILAGDQPAVTIENALGLLEGLSLTPPTTPRKRKVELLTPGATAVLEALDKLVAEHAEDEIPSQHAEGTQAFCLGTHAWCIPRPFRGFGHQGEDSVPTGCPLQEIWTGWAAERGPKLRDPDGLELVRARLLLDVSVEDGPDLPVWMRVAADLMGPGGWAKGWLKAVVGGKAPGLNYSTVCQRVLEWLLALDPPNGTAPFLMDVVEHGFALIPAKVLPQLNSAHMPFGMRSSWRSSSPPMQLHGLARLLKQVNPEQWTPELERRWWGLTRWIDEPGVTPAPIKREDVPEMYRYMMDHIGTDDTVPGYWRERPPVDDFLAACTAGAVTPGDRIDQLLGPRGPRGFQALNHLTARANAAVLAKLPELAADVERCRDRILEVELTRGDTPTAASPAARSLASVEGAEWFVKLLAAFGKDNLHRGWSYGQGRSEVLSWLLKVSRPAADDTVEGMAALVKQHQVKPQRLLEAAVYAPHWARMIEGVLQQPGLEDAVWWIHAHTKEQSWSVDQEIRASWQAEVAARTPLSEQDLLDGAVDVAWYNRLRQELDAATWTKLQKLAKYASSGSGHARAQQFAAALDGELPKAELLARVQDKRHQDSLRALGLVPLDQADPTADLLQRYDEIQEFLRTRKQFGSQRQASELRAGTIALENLARTAGYPDPLRLEWAMERENLADLREGPLSVAIEDVTLTLLVDAMGDPDLTVAKGGKTLQAVPAKLRKHEQVVALRERRTELRRQASRVRDSLEQAMIRGDEFTGDELADLTEHALLRPRLEALIWATADAMGYLAEGGRALRGHDGTLTPLGGTEPVRLAHPHDLLASGQWQAWQAECFRAERVQPFKQVFRELYPLTDSERGEPTSKRYAGHQVNPAQARALLTRRGWLCSFEEGVSKTFHEAGLTASMDFVNPWFTPLEMEGLTLENVLFADRKTGKLMPCEQVPPRLFSEVMRDLDLVVSVAHLGGVDPEATASTVEMRASLARETCRLMKLDNVTLDEPRASIEGHYGKYTVHLGSGVVHRLPGGFVAITAIGAQHRGRLFLPFADDDPRTAEVLSKILLLARDREIKDPTILSQIAPRP